MAGAAAGGASPDRVGDRGGGGAGEEGVGGKVVPLSDVPEDLNRVSEEELRRAKEAMNATFEANALKPGDPGYVHDKAVDFEGDKVPRHTPHRQHT